MAGLGVASGGGGDGGGGGHGEEEMGWFCLFEGNVIVFGFLK